MASLVSARDDYFLEVARGNILGQSLFIKFGRNPDVDANVEEDVWDAGGIYSFPTRSQIHDLTSTNANDNINGTGARTVKVIGLDSNFDEQEEIVKLDGDNDVATENAYSRVFRMITTSAGAGEGNAGNITATGQVDSTVSAQISVGENQTLMAIYTIPNGKTGFMTNFYFNMTKTAAAGSVDFNLRIRPFEEVFQIKHHLGLRSDGTSYVQHFYNPPLKVDQKSDIKVSATPDQNDNDVRAGFAIVLIDNE